jgi:hypothetical protein
MRTLIMTVLALLAGFAVGFALSRLIGMVGLLVFDQAVEIRYLPIVLAFVFASAELLVDMPMLRRSR